MHSEEKESSTNMLGYSGHVKNEMKVLSLNLKKLNSKWIKDLVLDTFFFF